jgi:hypothetical protein
MHIQVDRFLALTAMLAGFVPAGGPGRAEGSERDGVAPASAGDSGPRASDEVQPVRRARPVQRRG